MALRDRIKNKVVRNSLFWFRYIKNFLTSLAVRLFLHLFNRKDMKMLEKLGEDLKNFYSPVNLANPQQFYDGKNILGYPALAKVQKDGRFIGWSNGKIIISGKQLIFLQVATDIEINLPALFNKFKPAIIVDFGTAAGGSAIFFYELARKYCLQPKVLSIDITSQSFENAREFHQYNHTEEKINFLFGKSSIDCLEEVKNFLSSRRPGEKVLFSFDDKHTYEHTYLELKMYTPLLSSGDVILMQDTWDQGLFGHETSPLLAVNRFLKEQPGYVLDLEFLKTVEMPCNFIHGVIVKV